MSQHLFTPEESKEFYTNERCHILEMLNNHNKSKPFSIARARVEPGVTTAWHRLSGITEYYFILEGYGRMEIGENESFEVKPQDVIEIPPATPQRITNIGEEDLLFLAICSPPFQDEDYEDLD